MRTERIPVVNPVEISEGPMTPVSNASVTAKSPNRLSVTKLRKSLSPNKELNLLTVNNSQKLMSFKKSFHKIIINNGASTCGTGQRSKLCDLKPTTCSVSAASGESAQSTEMGLLTTFMLPTMVIKQMKDTTLLSVSQACAKGFVVLFTYKDCKFFQAKDIIPHQPSPRLPNQS